ncbi:hypothetical protein ACP4OV_023530 [Aristida adscensionis]
MRASAHRRKYQDDGIHKAGACGTKPNQEIVITRSRFGETAINDWSIADAPGSNATIIGQAQGLHTQASQGNRDSFTIIMNLVFQDGRFKGSTLQAMGFIHEDGQWSIMGGTGQLTLARGYISHRVIESAKTYRIYEANIRVYYTRLGRIH